MAVAAVLATQLNTAAATFFGLFVDGFDVSKEPASPSRYGVDWATCNVTISGPGGTSAMEWDIDDPSRLLVFVEGQEVRLVVNGQTDFVGFIDVATASEFGALGRIWHLKASGIEAIADWCTLYFDLLILAGTTLAAAVQAIVAACPNTGPLNVASGNAGGNNSTTATPILDNAVSLPANLTIASGTTMRRAVELAIAAAGPYPSSSPGWRFTIDPFGGVRLYQLAAPTPIATDGDGTITLSQAATPPISGDTFTRDGTTAIRTVTVRGTTGSATVGDGSGRRGRSIVILDTTLTTIAQCLTAAQVYLAAHQSSIRGRARLEEGGAIPDMLSVISKKLAITNPATGSTGTYEIGEISMTFNGNGIPSCLFTYGGVAPRFSDVVRRMAAAAGGALI